MGGTARRGGADAAFGGMFHLPHGCAQLTGRDDSARFDSVAKLGVFTHAITNRRVSFEVWSAVARDAIAENASDAIWIEPSELDRVPHPSYVRKAIALWRAPSGA